VFTLLDWRASHVPKANHGFIVLANHEDLMLTRLLPATYMNTRRFRQTDLKSHCRPRISLSRVSILKPLLDSLSPSNNMIALRALATLALAAFVAAQTVRQCRASPACPRDNRCIATISNGAKFEMRCGVDYDTSRIVGITQVCPLVVLPEHYNESCIDRACIRLRLSSIVGRLVHGMWNAKLST
jgi:hypothetical protein